MNFIEKARYLKHRQSLKDYDKDKYYIDALFKKQSFWKEGEIENLLMPYNFIPISYLEFIKEFDGAGISFVGFYGSKTEGIRNNLYTWINEHKKYLKIDYFPFGKEPAGGVFAFNKKHQVVLFDAKDYEFEQEPELIAETFEEFMDECVMGKRYPEFVEEDECYEYYKYLGWV